MGKVTALLAGLDTVMIDTCCFIYYIQSGQYPVFAPIVEELFDLISSGQVKALTSPITIAEILNHPRRMGLDDIAYAYKLLLINFPNLAIPNIDVDVADKAATLRGIHGLKTPDALQVATGIVHHAEAFVTFDKEIKKVAAMTRVVVLDEN
jgi:predicted nucleic acid-binding protein